MDSYAIIRCASPTPRDSHTDADPRCENPGEQLLDWGELDAEVEIPPLEAPQLNSDTSKDKRHGRNCFPSLCRKIGSWWLFVSIFSIIILLVVIGFLIWLWMGNRSDGNWRRIALEDLLKEATTLSALLARAAVSALAVVSTSMIASIAIEGRGVPLEYSAMVSIARFSNSGPFTFWRLYKLKFFDNFLLTALTVALLVTTIAAQFSSTFLLFDLGQGPVISFPTDGTNVSGLTYTSFNLDGGPNPASPLFFEPGYWTHAPITYETFAEFSQPNSPSDTMEDTGISLRSFLPIGDQRFREALRGFHGSAPVFDSRVVCVRPNITDLRICDANPITLCGNFTADTSAPGLVAWNGSVGFDCKMPSQKELSNEAKGSAWLLCFLDSYAGGLISVLDPTNNQSLRHTWNSTVSRRKISSKIGRDGNWVAHNGESSWYVDLGQGYIVMNASEPFASAGPLLWTSQASGPWTQVKYSANSSEEYFRMSICYDALPIPLSADSIQEFNITTTDTEGTRREPIVQWDSKAARFDTTAIRKQLGAGKRWLTAEDRGILNLSSADTIFQQIDQLRKIWKIPQNDSDTRVFNTSTYPWVIPMVLDELSSIALCPKCSHHSIRQGSNVLITVFKDVIEDTNSPALALQAILTIVTRMAYYDWLPLFNEEYSSITTSFQQALVPLRYQGFAAVLTILIVHLLLCLATAYYFDRYSHQTLLNNSWQTIAQLSSNPGANPVLERAYMTSEKKVKKWIREDTKLRQQRFRLGHVSSEK